MKIKLKPFQKAVNKTYKIFSEDKNPETISKNKIKLTIFQDSPNMIISASYKQGSQFSTPLSVFINIGHVEDAKPINLALHAQTFFSLVKGLHGNDICIQMQNDKPDRIFIYTDEDKQTGASLPIESLEPVDALDDKSDQKYIGTLHLQMLSKYLKETIHAIEAKPSDMFRYSFCFEADADGNIRVTTTDGYRCSSRFGSINGIKYSYTIPKKELIKAARLLENAVTIRIPADDDYIQMVNDNIIVVIPVYKIKYFNMDLIIEREIHKKILTMTVCRQNLLQICKTHLQPRQILILKTEGNILQIGSSAENEQLSIEKTLPTAKQPQNKDVYFNLYAKYLYDALRHMDAYNIDITPCENICIITRNSKWDGWGNRPVSPIKGIELIPIKHV